MKTIEKYLDFIAQNTGILVDVLGLSCSYLASINTFESRRVIEEEKAKACNKDKLWTYGYKVYSQNEEDGIIAEIFKRIGTTTRTFIEFGIEAGQCNTLKLLFEGWQGLWMEKSSDEKMNEILKIRDQFNGRLKVKSAFITAENINELLEETAEWGEIDLLTIDVDCNDYWIWRALTVVKPRVVVIEYNALFPPPMSLTVPYDPKGAWPSICNYFGASLEAITWLSHIKGYSLVGCNFTGINAFYVRNDLIKDDVFLEPFTTEKHYEPTRYNVYTGLGRHPLKIGPYVDPREVKYRLEMISAALDAADYELATKMANAVINETDAKGEAYHYLAVAAARQSRHEEAIELYDKALELGVSNPIRTHWYKGKALYCIGHYKEGWKEFEWRALEHGQTPFTRFDHNKLWKNQPPPASIHIHLEAGAGDNINFVRYLKLLVDMGYDVRYETYHDMVDLMARSFPDVKVVGRALDYPGSTGLEPYDYHHPICGLPHVLGTEVNTAPWFGPYIKPNPELVKKYAERLPKDKKKIGICWFSGIRKGGWEEKYGLYKSIHFDKLKPLFEIDDNLYFVSLQVGKRRKQNVGIIEDLLPEDDDITWDETAALVENLDLIISVDTAVLHLAGAMGKPVWAMSQKDTASWHLMCWRPGALWNETSPWYPTMRIFRQHRFNESNYWDEVIEDIAKELEIRN